MKEGLVLTFEQMPGAVAQLFNELKEIKQLLVNQEIKPKTNLWLNLAELCKYLPDKPAKATVYTWVSNGFIPYHKKGRKLSFLVSEVDEWLKSGRKKTIAEIQAEATEQVVSKNKKG